MVYKWCVVPLCKNTSIKSPHKLFVSVPKIPKRRNMWLQLAHRDPTSILLSTNVFMCEDHFNMEKDVINYMQYKYGFSQKLLLTNEAAPTKFDCQKNLKRQLSDAGFSRKVFLKRQKIDLVTECLQSQSATETHTESLQKDDNMIQETIEPEELPKTQDKETIITINKSVQVTTKVNMHYRSRTAQTRFQKHSISTSRFTSPFKIEPCNIEPLRLKAVKRNIVLDDEKSDSDISSFESGHLSSFVATSSSKSEPQNQKHIEMFPVKQEDIKEEPEEVDLLEDIDVYDEFSKYYKQEFQENLDVKEENLSDSNINIKEQQNEDLTEDTKYSDEYLTHSNERPYKCDKCEYSCKVKSYLNTHKLRHSNERPFKCDQCDYCCRHKCSLNLHKLRHSNERPFKCEQCEYSTNQKSCINRHKLIHTNKRPFKCDQCYYSCNHKASLIRHKLHHSNE